MLRELSVAFSSSAPRSGYAEAVEFNVHLANGEYEAAEKTARNLHDRAKGSPKKTKKKFFKTSLCSPNEEFRGSTGVLFTGDRRTTPPGPYTNRVTKPRYQMKDGTIRLIRASV